MLIKSHKVAACFMSAEIPSRSLIKNSNLKKVFPLALDSELYTHADKCRRLQIHLKFIRVLFCLICNYIEPVNWKYGKVECRFYLLHQKLFSKYLFPLFQFSIMPLYPLYLYTNFPISIHL